VAWVDHGLAFEYVPAIPDTKSWIHQGVQCIKEDRDAMTRFMKAIRIRGIALAVGLLIAATTSVHAAPIQFTIADLGAFSGRGLDNDGHVIDKPIRNIVDVPWGGSDLTSVIDGTADGRLLLVSFDNYMSHDPDAYMYNPHSTAPWNGPLISVGGAEAFLKMSLGTDMNAQGDVVGSAEWGGVAGERPFYAAADSLRILRDLNDLIPPDSGWRLTDVYSINDRGQMLGTGYNPEGQQTTFLLTPAAVPEPGAWAVFGLAAAAFAWRKRRAG
jgi:hypothetical protein